ncbi:MAG TPA: hypothetical protein VME24_00680 [Alphaproteobacteria bacterium]|nr:hypothetical protein [Alphaproteobacteria bacterium]
MPSEPFKTLPQPGEKPKITEQPAQPLFVKELAAALGVSLRFIYQMRACGFSMHGDTRYRQMATVEEARAWIKANNFRLNKSFGVTEPAKAAAPPPVAAQPGQ